MCFFKKVFLSLPRLLISSLSSNVYFGARNHPSKVSYKVNFKVGHNVKIQRGGDGFVGFVGPGFFCKNEALQCV